MTRRYTSTSEFTGSSVIPAPPNLANSHTLMCWVNVAAFPSSGTASFLQVNNVGFTSYAILQTSSSGFLSAQQIVGGSLVYSYASTALSLNTWTHVALQYDSATSTNSTWVNGVQVNSAVASLAGRAAVSNVAVIGATGGDIQVESAQIVMSVLSAAAIKTASRAQPPVVTASANVNLRWPLQVGIYKARDFSGLKNDATVDTSIAGTVFVPVRALHSRRIFLPQYKLQPPIVATAASRTNAPPAAIASSSPVASTAASVTNVPNVTLSRSYAFASVASTATDCPAAAISASASIASTCSTVTNCPSASVTTGLGAVALTTTDVPAVTLQRNLPIVGTASNVTNATAAIGASAAAASTAGNVTNAPTAAVTSSATVASVAAARSDAPSASVTAGANVASVASTATNCPAAAISRLLLVASVAGSRSDCPPANIAPLVFLPVASVCGNRTDCPPPPPMTFFKDLTAPPMTLGRAWPPRPR